jgi:FtsP/CotA-like multicopper oxidase with cupredoxin domain
MMDGANGVTECPLAPGKTKTYTFKATQYGTSWYHSHFSAQYANGVWGTIHIDGPASNNYDIDLGVFPINDYYYKTADELVVITSTQGPPPSDNVLFNGTNINPLDSTKGKYANVTITPGKRHRLRIINTSVENHFTVSLVGHQFTVLSTDLVPVNSFSTDSLFVAIGQRYDVFFEASQPVGNYWFNATVGGSTGCGSSTNLHPAAIFHYAGAATNALPTNQGTAPPDSACQDRTNFTPVVSRTANATGFTPSIADTLPVSVNFASSPVRWQVNGSAINVQWDKPVLQYVIDGNTSYPTSENLVFVNQQNVWTYWVIENTTPIPHPMHLHGHDFLLLGTGAGTFSSSNFGQLNFNNPNRRDVTMLPASGWIVLAFMADNPGNWLMHCHIAWHVSGGLSVDFMERRSEQAALISSSDLAAFEQVCADWKAYEPSAPPKIDSGLR